MNIPNNFIVVDDDPVSNMICSFAIQGLNANAKIDLFLEPEAALEAIGTICEESSENNPFVLFLDLNMPSMTGWEFLEELDKMDERLSDLLTVYILSSSLDAGDMEKAGNHPLVMGFISKPMTVGILKQQIGQEVRTTIVA